VLAGRGGGATAEFAGGCVGAARGRVGALGSGGEERQRGNEPASALASAGEGGRVGTGSGRGCRAAGDADAWSPRGEQALPRSGRAARRVSGQARGGRPGVVRRWAGPSEARRAREAGWADFGRGPEAKRRPTKEEKAFSKYIFKEFLNAIFKYYFEQ